MPTLNLWFQFIGIEPTNWSESFVELQNGVWMQNVSATRSCSVQGGDGLFRQQLPERVWTLFDRTRRAGRCSFDAIALTGDPDKGSVQSKDLLCYVCDNKVRSVIRRFDEARFQAALQRAGQENPNGTVAGMTVNFDNGICSEIYVADCSTDITWCANNIYHEWMHNKSRWALNEDPVWVHTQGGGGLAAANGGQGVGLTAQTARIMCGRLAITNRQFVDGIPP
jgi:hypothetical protein